MAKSYLIYRSLFLWTCEGFPTDVNAGLQTIGIQWEADSSFSPGADSNHNLDVKKKGKRYCTYHMKTENTLPSCILTPQKGFSTVFGIRIGWVSNLNMNRPTQFRLTFNWPLLFEMPTFFQGGAFFLYDCNFTSGPMALKLCQYHRTVITLTANLLPVFTAMWNQNLLLHIHHVQRIYMIHIFMHMHMVNKSSCG